MLLRHLLLVCASAMAASVAFGQTIPGVTPEARVLALNQELVRLGGQPREAVLGRLRTVTKLRLEALREQAELDPARALAMILPESTLNSLRAFGADIAADIETEGEWIAPAEVVMEDDFQHRTSRVRFALLLAEGRIEVYGASALPELTTGVVVRSRGVKVGSMILSREASIAGSLALDGACSTKGVQRIAVILVNFLSSSIDTSVINATSIGNVISGGAHSTSGFWYEASYGQTTASGDVFGPFSLGANYTGAQYDAIRDAAITAAATTGGVNFSNYTHVVIIMPNGFPVGGGLGSIGCEALSSPTTGSFTAGVVWLRADIATPNDLGVCAFVHENGHNMGLSHASTEAYPSVPLGSFGTVPTHTEYGSFFSLMSLCDTINGTTLLGHYDAPHKVMLGWFAPSNYQSVSAGGSFVLAPIENTTPNLQAIRVQRGLENDFWLWLEYRKSLGYDATLAALDGQVYTGALIHFEDPANTPYALYTRLLNYTAPANSNFHRPALAVGSSWSDPYSLLTLNVTSADSAGLHVTVNYDTPCASLSPGSRNYPSSGAITNDPVGITASGGCSWTATSNADWITVTGGSSGTGSGTVTYSLTANNTPSPRTGSVTIARQKFTITQPSNNPQPTPVSASPINSSSAPNASQVFTLSYSDAGGAAAFAKARVLFNTSTSNVNACDITWVQADNTIRLTSDAGSGYSYWFANQSGQISNSQCRVNFNNAINILGNNLTFTVTVTFFNAFTGTKNVYLQGTDGLERTAAWCLKVRGRWGIRRP